MSLTPLPLHVFHAYDIRGLSPQEIDEAFAERLARAIVQLHDPRTVLIGRDMRRTSAVLEESLMATFVSLGVDVIAIGLCTTPMFYVSTASSEKPIDIGIMVTASHNPGIYNGFKLIYGDARPLGQGSGMEELTKAFEEDGRIERDGMNVAVDADRRVGPVSVITKGTISKDVLALEQYIDRVMELARLPSDMPRRKIVIDTGNGMAAAVLPEFLRRLPWLEIVPLYFELDGNFPNHEANPMKRETLKDLVEAVKREEADFGVAFDGDADRIGFVDENGEIVPGDIGTALFAREVLRDKPGGLVLYDIRSSWSVAEVVERAGGRAKMCRAGHAYIKRQMSQEDIVFAGEASMHYFFKDLFNVESGDLVFLYLLKCLAREEKSLSALWKPLMSYAHSGEINFKVDNKSTIITQLKERYMPQATSMYDIDGIRLEFRDPNHSENDWWFSVRASNTEPLLRLNVETRTKEQTEKKVEELSAMIV